MCATRREATLLSGNLGYFIHEGFKGIRRNIGTTIGSVLTIFLSLMLIGTFVIGNDIVGNIMGSIEDQVSITAYISDSALDDQQSVDDARAQIEELPGVASVTYVSKDEAMQDFKDSLGSNTSMVDSLDGENPLPASFEVTLDDPENVEQVASSITSLDSYKRIADDQDNVSNSVRYGQQITERLFSVTNAVRLIGSALVIMLIFVAFVFINNTIRLAVMNRSKEIGIQRLVGASNSFIRGPFMAEGTIQSLIGALLAIACIELIRRLAIPKIAESVTWLPMNLAGSVYIKVYLVIIVAGLLIGIIGSALAMRKHLKI